LYLKYEITEIEDKTNTMNTKEIADKLVQYCRTGEFDKCYAELYSPKIVSLEMPGTPFPEKVEGFEGIKQKGEAWQSMMEEFHGAEISEPIVAGDHFAIKMVMDITQKGEARKKDEELCMYRVEDGKIVSEQFFYATAQQPA